jgi:hypothetical protein
MDPSPPPPLRRSNNSGGPPPPLPRLVNRPRRTPSPQRVFGEHEALPPPPRLHRADASQTHLSAHEINGILMNDLSEASVRRVLPDIRALSPSQRTHLMNDLKQAKIIPPRVEQMLGQMKKSKRRKLKKAVSRRRRSRR